MRNLRVANRYAKAFLGFAEEQSISEQAYQDMQLVYDTFQSSPELRVILKSPIVRVTKKLNILNGIFKDKLNSLSLHYLNVVIRKNRAALIEGIAFEYLRIHRESLNIESVKLITADVVDEQLREKAIAAASRLTTRNIEFSEIIRPDIVGGFILQVGDLQYDVSVKRYLSQLKKKLLEL